jgi:hypothetical protein
MTYTILIARRSRQTDPVSLFWLTHPDGRAAGVVVIESGGLLHARLKAAQAGADRDLNSRPRTSWVGRGRPDPAEQDGAASG